jgi:hypothetical protein
MNDLRAWSLATFRTTSFMTTLVLWIHLRGTLGAFLKRLDTSIGFAFFVAFWVATWMATRIGLHLAERDAMAEPGSPDAALPTTIVAGGWNGVFVFAILALGILATFARAQGPVSALTAVPVFLLVLVMGGLLAFTIGGIAGFVYGLVDAFVGMISRALFHYVARRP